MTTDVQADFAAGLRDLAAELDDGELLLIYGSWAYGLADAASDLDVVAVVHTCDQARRRTFADAVIRFHEHAGLTLDAEVPFHQKSIGCFSDIDAACNGVCFDADGEMLRVARVVKTPEFLGSEAMRLRLLLNAVTGKVVTAFGSAETTRELQLQARHAWLELLPRITGRPMTSAAEVADALISDSDSGREGEWYLGFRNSTAIRRCLLDAFTPLMSGGDPNQP